MSFSEFLVSFVHAYQESTHAPESNMAPALWNISGTEEKILGYPFPRQPDDFHEYSQVMAGNLPLSNTEPFKKLPRFGFTGLAHTKEFIYAGSWNAVYEIKRDNLELNRIISNNLMSDLHGIWVDENFIITVLTGKDTVVISDKDGVVIEHYSISHDLSVHVDEDLNDLDWRFLSKQFRGATGRFHFNFVQLFGDEIWLTARNLSAFVVVSRSRKVAWLRTINHKTPVLLHDGIRHNGRYYFTSIDAKIIIAAEPELLEDNPRETIDSIGRYERDFASNIIRIEDSGYGRFPNWCRGLAVCDTDVYCTVDGRYGTQKSFGLAGFSLSGEFLKEYRLNWSAIGNEGDFQYVTGFDVLCLEAMA